jgi:hypothetical protein
MIYSRKLRSNDSVSLISFFSTSKWCEPCLLSPHLLKEDVFIYSFNKHLVELLSNTRNKGYYDDQTGNISALMKLIRHEDTIYHWISHESWEPGLDRCWMAALDWWVRRPSWLSGRIRGTGATEGWHSWSKAQAKAIFVGLRNTRKAKGSGENGGTLAENQAGVNPQRNLEAH